MSNRRERFDRPDGDDYYDMPEERDVRRGGNGRYRHVRDSAQDAVRRANSRGRSRKGSGASRLMNKRGLLIAALLGGIALLALVIYVLVSRTAAPAAQPQTATQTKQAPASPAPDQPTAAPATDKPNGGPLPWLTGSRPLSGPEAADEGLPTVVARTTLKLALAALLAAMLAFRPRKDLPVLQRNPYVAQTQILLAVVASALMMIVADNAARAFGIFAAASLVRFRTNIRDPKEITILLISLGIGLATGVGRVELAVILALFVLVMLWVLEYYEPTQVFRAMELTVTTRKVDETDEILREIFERRDLTTEIRKVDREDEDDPLGKIVYYVNISPSTSTDQLSEEIFGSDPDNIDSIQWDQKKSNSYIYR
jgi:uncharacterized membrane protein YhiD involved in acid resistance